MSGQHKYRAFISYSHADEKWAAWLHKALETYKVPKHLVGKASEYGPVPERIAPIFRDREELATSTELGDVLTEALKQSACLIVICSPNAAKSRWTNEEILTYKRLGRQDRIFCLIVDGEPNASLFEETAEFECFPEGLMYQMDPDGNLTNIRSEPIAADAREGKDNKQNAKLKLIAGMIGVGFDDLKQREQHRRHQRMVAVTAAAAIGMAITTGLAATAWFARIEAVQQRVRAEEKAEEARQTTQFMVGLFEVSDPSESLGNTITAREILDKGAERIETELTDQPAIQATLMDTMGTVYTSLGLYDAAIPLVENSLVKRRVLFGDEHLEVAQSLNHLGEVQTLKAGYAEAEEHLRDALAVRRKLLGDTAPEVAETLADLADVLSRQGEYAQAEPLIRESLEIRRTALGGKHSEVAESLEDLALNLFDQGDFESPVPLLREAVAMRRELQGSSHPDLAEALNNLGFVLGEVGEYREAEALFREALEMKRYLLGDTHPEIAMGLNNVAFSLHDQGEYDAAEAMYRDAIAMQQKLLGNNHPDVAMAMNNLAFLYHDRGDQARAIELARDSLQMKRSVLGDEHPEVARGINNVAMWIMEDGDYAIAEPMLRASLAMNIKLLGNEHPDVASSMTLLASCLVATTRFEEARELAGRARKVYTKALSEDHWRTAVAVSAEGAALTGLRKYPEAETLLVKSYGVLSNDEGALPMFVTEATRRLAALYEDWGKPEQAADYFALLREP